MSDLEELLTTVEQLRASKYPTLSSELVCQILKVEAEQPDNRVVAIREIKKLVQAALASVLSHA